MADLFRCDRCGGIGPLDNKAGRLIIQELGRADQMAHPSLYNRKAELCDGCFQTFKTSLDRQMQKPTLEQSADIVREARGVLT